MGRCNDLITGAVLRREGICTIDNLKHWLSALILIVSPLKPRLHKGLVLSRLGVSKMLLSRAAYRKILEGCRAQFDVLHLQTGSKLNSEIYFSMYCACLKRTADDVQTLRAM